MEWAGCRNNSGYGVVSFNGKKYMAHRLSLELSVGKPEGNLMALHSCDNPSCINPMHLRWGTHAENMADMVKRNRTNAPKGINHYAATISEEVAAKIKFDKRPCSAVAEEFDVSCSIVSKIRTGSKWKCIKGIENE